ncbi:MAG: prepilin-type N-terminal cleavage/methylation domain-containing protein [Bdellovibrionales bacterium]|jgi:prepilin-type N-terminal cleavage/methylation domain-containing protein
MLALSHAKKRRGVSLVETSIVLAIVGVVLGAIWVAAASVREEQRDNDAVTQLQMVVHNITVLKQTQGVSFSGAFPLNITSSMISAGAIPRTFVNATATTTADTPWRPGLFVIFQIAAKKFRVSFYSPSFRGCVLLLLNATACTVGDAECPTAIVTSSGAYSLLPDASIGWKNMTPTAANTACNANSSNPSVEFDYVF